jgi:hypothetical protein
VAGKVSSRNVAVVRALRSSCSSGYGGCRGEIEGCGLLKLRTRGWGRAGEVRAALCRALRRTAGILLAWFDHHLRTVIPVVPAGSAPGDGSRISAFLAGTDYRDSVASREDRLPCATLSGLSINGLSIGSGGETQIGLVNVTAGFTGPLH